MDEKTYKSLKEQIPSPPDYKLCTVFHEYQENCSNFNFVILIFIPTIVISIVFRMVYGWRTRKAIKKHQPARFFLHSPEIKVFAKKNIKFVRKAIASMLTMQWL